ncbi:CST complex subunit Ten1 [Lasiosphaeris hirsuta]|uniref:CST complex subunit Ten1 n=1 Tax=Lasiosphaeris hirsuta TaxID=260670 RepID=A0AA40DZW2_9PEZI|nr:CST complex subunit Ten1 [Lasiosphaeris hirsuta]
MPNNPPPSQLCLLSALPSKEVGEKVRFLGCVLSYLTASATLMLEHRRPKDNTGPIVRVYVNVDHVLERLGAQQTRAGQWLNVIGYITAAPPSTNARISSDHQASIVPVSIQAVLIWSAGALDVQRYEAVVETLQVEKSSHSSDEVPSDALLRARG